MADMSTPPDHGPQDVAEAPGPRFGVLGDLGWLSLSVVLAFATATAGGFVWRDHDDIQAAGYRITRADDWRAIWVSSQEQYRWRRTGIAADGEGRWRPIYAVSISLDWLLWKDRPWCYHVENIFWHWLVVAGLYLLGRRLFAPLPAGRRVVFWATLLLAVHPFGVYSVAWISGRTDTMCAAFGVAALLAFSQVEKGSGPFCAKDPSGRSGKRVLTPLPFRARRGWPPGALWLTVSAVCLALSVGSKELGLVVPLVATALFWPPLGLGEDPDRRRLRAVRLAGLGVLWGCAVALAAYRVAVVGTWSQAASYPTDSFARSAATSANLWWHYVARTLTPAETRLSDAWPVVETVGILDILAMLGIVAVLGVLVYGSYRHRPWVCGLWWYVIWMLPASGLLPLCRFRAERYLYPASWGLLLAVMMFFLLPASGEESGRGRRTATLLLIGIALWLALTTAYANTFWRDDSTLFGHSLTQDPRHVEARTMLARMAFGRKDIAESVRQLRQVTSDLDEGSFVAYGDPYSARTNLGTALLYVQLNSEALSEFTAALQYRPQSPEAHHNVGLAAFAAGNLPLAKKHHGRALELAPKSPAYRHNLAVALLRLGEAKACLQLLRDYVQNHQNDLICMHDFASALLVLQRFDEAEPHFEILVGKQPENPVLRAQLALCQWKTGKQEQARRNYQQARKKAPNHPVVRQVAGLIAGQEAEPEDGEPEKREQNGPKKPEGGETE